MIYLRQWKTIRYFLNPISLNQLNPKLVGGIVCPWNALNESNFDQKYSQIKNLRYEGVNNNLEDLIDRNGAATKYTFNTEAVATTPLIRNALGNRAVEINGVVYVDKFKIKYIQSAISVGPYRSSLDRYQDISNFFAYELYNCKYGLMLPTPRYRSSIIVPFQLNKVANNAEVVNQTVKLIHSFLVEAYRHYTQLNLDHSLTNANYNYSEYNLPRPVLFQTLVNMIGPEREMVKQKNEAVERILPRVNKQAMRQHRLDNFQKSNLLLISTNHSLNRNKKTFGALANFVTDHRVFGKSGVNIQELKYVVLAFSNYLYMVLHKYQGLSNKDYLKDEILKLLYTKSRYSVFINDILGSESPEIKRCALIAAMLNIYSYLMHMTFVNRRVMLQRAAYETLIISLCGGIVHSSCKSGKDREGMIVVFTDALLIYIDNYGHCPDLENKIDKQFFAEIFVQCFFSGNAMSISAMTALYAYGIKNLTGILPDFLQEALQRHDLQQYRMIKKASSLNKVEIDELNHYRQEHQQQIVEFNKETRNQLRGRFNNLYLGNAHNLDGYQNLFRSDNHDPNNISHQAAAGRLYCEVNNYRH